MMDPHKPILVAGDDPLIVDLLRHLLALHGYPVITASDQKDLPHHAAFSVALLDLDPVTAGGAKRIRRLREGLRDGVPIIALTVEDDLHDLAREFDVHVCFPKPFDIDRLLQTIHYLSTSLASTTNPHL